MTKHQHPKPGPRPMAQGLDPAHAPGKQHLAREHAAPGSGVIDQRQMRQRAAGRGAQTHDRRQERGR
jgi:hypothetical protein